MLAAAVARMRTAKRQEQTPAHGVPNVPSRTQGWFGRGPAEERRAAAIVAGLSGVLPPTKVVATVRPELASWTCLRRVCVWRTKTHLYLWIDLFHWRRR